MKVLILADFRSPHAWLWVESYRKYGFDVHLLSMEELPSGAENFYFIEGKGRFKYILGVRKLKRILNELKPAFIHANMVPNYGLMAYLSGYDYILSPWGRDVLSVSYKPFRGWIFKRILKKAKIVHTDGRIVKWLLVNRFGVNPFKIMDFPYGLKDEILNYELKPLKKDKFVLVEYRKHENEIYNQGNLIKAIHILVHEWNVKNFVLLMLSYGKDTPYFKRVVSELSLQDFVKFEGFAGNEPYTTPKERIFSHLSKAHIYISASLVDSTSVSLLEAMNFGAMPVVSDICANQEWVIDNFNGKLFDPLNPYDIAHALKEAMNFDFIEKARIMNKNLVLKKANWNENFEKFIQFLKKIPSEYRIRRRKFPWNYIR